MCRAATDPVWIFYQSLLSLVVCFGHIFSPAHSSPDCPFLQSDLLLCDCLPGLKDFHLALLDFFLETIQTLRYLSFRTIGTHTWSVVDYCLIPYEKMKKGKQTRPGRATSRNRSQPPTPGGREKVTQIITNKQKLDSYQTFEVMHVSDMLNGASIINTIDSSTCKVKR